ncbi:MAG: DegV family protein, partial [bacterium]|nr:DegV family protein [bacterium]
MKTIHIVTDSGADLPISYVDNSKMTIVPLYVIIEEQTLRDGLDIHNVDLYSKMAVDKVVPRTSQPSPEDFRLAFE